MVDEHLPDGGSDRFSVEMEPGGPVELASLTESFAGLARFYERHYRSSGEPSPKLYVVRLETGSIVAEVAPYALLLGQVVSTMDMSMVVADFTRKFSAALRTFSDWPSPTVAETTEPPSRQDAEDIKAFIKPLAGRSKASLRVRHARYHSKTADREVVVEYKFDSAELNRATINIDADIRPVIALDERGQEGQIPIASYIEGSTHASSEMRNEVMLFIDQASQRPGRARGRTGDRGVAPEISPKSLPIYFLQSLHYLKDQMVKGDLNPFNHAFVVDVMVQILHGQPAGYTITHVHEIVPRDE